MIEIQIGTLLMLPRGPFFFTLVVFRSSCSKGFVDVFEVHSPFIVINVLKCNPKCNGLMACLL